MPIGRHQPGTLTSDSEQEEEFQDGLHVVYGHVDRREPSCSATFVAHGVRFLLDPEDVVEPCRVPERSPDPEWMARVQREEMGITPDLGPVPRAGSGSLPSGGAAEGELR